MSTKMFWQIAGLILIAGAVLWAVYTVRAWQSQRELGDQYNQLVTTTSPPSRNYTDEELMGNDITTPEPPANAAP